NPSEGTLIGCGSHTITVTATDTAGNSATVQVALNVVDKTAPVIVSRPESITLSDCPPVIPDIRSQIIATDNCTPADHLTITQNPAPGVSPGDGRAITVKVTDASGNCASVSIPFTVADISPPTIVSAPDSVAISNRFGLVPNVVPSIVAVDNCTPADQLVIEQDPPAHSHLSRDLQAIVVPVTDAAGNQTSQSIPVVIRDKTAPLITSTEVDPNVLWPPNHKMVPVKVAIRARDDVDPAPVSKIISITSNESMSRNEV